MLTAARKISTSSVPPKKVGHLPIPVYLKDRKQWGQSGLLKAVEPDLAISMIRDFIGAVPVKRFYSLGPYRRHCRQVGPEIISSCSHPRSFRRFAETRS